MRRRAQSRDGTRARSKSWQASPGDEAVDAGTAAGAEAGASSGAGPGAGRLLHESVVEVNEQAMRVTRRIEMKLNGRELSDRAVPVEQQVDRLIAQARAPENLAQMFVGWCAFW